MTALLIVAQQHGLNPWTKEIYAFPDRQNGIVPVVGVDGWARIINTHPQFDGMDFQQDEESCTCVIYRKDRSHPIKVTEWMAECRRPNVGPWQSHPRRMLRHKAMIQCARLAFGFGGIYDEDEAQRIVEGEARDVTNHASPIRSAQLPAPDPISEEDEAKADEFRTAIADATSVEALTELAAGIGKLPKPLKDALKPVWAARRDELAPKVEA
jgi:hypothetical protein